MTPPKSSVLASPRKGSSSTLVDEQREKQHASTELGKKPTEFIRFEPRDPANPYEWGPVSGLSIPF